MPGWYVLHMYHHCLKLIFWFNMLSATPKFWAFKNLKPQCDITYSAFIYDSIQADTSVMYYILFLDILVTPLLLSISLTEFNETNLSWRTIVGDKDARFVRIKWYDHLTTIMLTLLILNSKRIPYWLFFNLRSYTQPSFLQWFKNEIIYHYFTKIIFMVRFGNKHVNKEIWIKEIRWQFTCSQT